MSTIKTKNIKQVQDIAKVVWTDEVKLAYQEQLKQNDNLTK